MMKKIPEENQRVGKIRKLDRGSEVDDPVEAGSNVRAA
jgi:hypothetical protein